jgi:hypothetical protein
VLGVLCSGRPGCGAGRKGITIAEHLSGVFNYG